MYTYCYSPLTRYLALLPINCILPGAIREPYPLLLQLASYVLLYPLGGCLAYIYIYLSSLSIDENYNHIKSNLKALVFGPICEYSNHRLQD